MLKKDLRSYSNRLSKQMDKIANVGSKVETYFYDSYQKCANLEFTEDAIAAFKDVGRLAGLAAIEIYRGIDKHIETMHFFLAKWQTSREIDKKTMKLANRFFNELKQLKNYFEDTPPDLMADVIKIIMRKNQKGY
ncbi:MAG: hypothetical protein PVG41_07225 [Desulfobacteraceae bacterium]|jgi:hypothetical protein